MRVLEGSPWSGVLVAVIGMGWYWIGIRIEPGNASMCSALRLMATDDRFSKWRSSGQMSEGVL